jgi:hypothetical protein
MDFTILDTIAFTPNLPELINKLRIRPESAHAVELQAMVSEAQATARPKAAYKVAFVEARQEDKVIIDGVTFTSRVLRTNLESLHRVYPFLATCGLELDAWVHSFTDVLAHFWADTIAETALLEAVRHLENWLSGLYLPASADLPVETKIPRFAEMNPGSLEEWPIDEQKPLFALLGNASERIGVQLGDTYLMHPIKSVSGIFFVNQEGYTNCRLCPREVCSGRQAPYDPELFEQKYAQARLT